MKMLKRTLWQHHSSANLSTTIVWLHITVHHMCAATKRFYLRSTFCGIFHCCNLVFIGFLSLCNFIASLCLDWLRRMQFVVWWRNSCHFVIGLKHFQRKRRKKSNDHRDMLAMEFWWNFARLIYQTECNEWTAWMDFRLHLSVLQLCNQKRKIDLRFRLTKGNLLSTKEHLQSEAKILPINSCD